MVSSLVYKKIILFSYFCLLMLLINLIPKITPDMSSKEQSAILFSYQNPSMLVAILSISTILFSYLSLIIPKIEINSIQTFISIRQPTKLKLVFLTSQISILYFCLYVCLKISAILIYPSKYTIFWTIVYVTQWIILLLISINKNKKISNMSILLSFICTEILATYTA